MADGTGRPAGGGAHLRWDEMAVGHVLGGLDEVDRSLFRDHLSGCTDCRLRVEELRTVAAELERAAADDTGERPIPSDEHAPTGRRWFDPETWRERRAGVVTLLALVGALVAVLLVLAIVGRDSELITTARVREATLQALGSGTPAQMTLADGVAGIVVASEGQVAWTLTGLPTLADDERLVMWFTSVGADSSAGPDIATRLLVYGNDQLLQGRLAGSVPDMTTDEIRVTIERVPLPTEPSGPQLLRADLPDGR